MKNEGIKTADYIRCWRLGSGSGLLAEDTDKVTAEWDLLGFVDDGVIGFAVEGLSGSGERLIVYFLWKRFHEW
ncbi:MAG: hypothetical protein PHU69_13110 [Fermentimonas sp.]|nr:hypothetical protein [Fermentimonas sp.]